MAHDPQSAEKGTRNLRRGRHSAANQIYQVTTVTQDRARIFADLLLGRIVVETLRRETALRRCDTLCFVVMPDHLHWLMQMTVCGALSDCVNSVKACSARRVNLLRGQTGRVWQKGFHDHAMRHDEDVVTTARYIIANPIRAGIVERVGDYPLWDAIWI